MAELQTYQLVLFLPNALQIQVGALGNFEFPAGYYIYTGSARRNLQARVQRHLQKEKKLRWHIDYLLGHASVRVVEIFYFSQPECEVNQFSGGRVLVTRFGASDCKAGCGSHLKFWGTEKPAAEKGIRLNLPEIGSAVPREKAK